MKVVFFFKEVTLIFRLKNCGDNNDKVLFLSGMFFVFFAKISGYLIFCLPEKSKYLLLIFLFFKR